MYFSTEDFAPDFGEAEFGEAGAGLTSSSEPIDTLTCDYLVIGAGNNGMCFVDGLMTFNKICTIIIVDERDSPGGQWHDAPSFAKLYQVSALYGCCSRKLESDRERKPGEPLERANKSQVISYFDSVMEDFLRTGRVRFFPNCTANWEGTEIVSNVCGHYSVKVRNKVVQTTYGVQELAFSESHIMPFKVQCGATVVSPLGLKNSGTAYTAYIIIGAGRVGADVILHLLDRGVPPQRIHWVMPREYWHVNREFLYPEKFGQFYMQFEDALLEIRCIKQMYKMLEQETGVFRLDTNIWPEGFHALCMLPSEHAQLAKVKNIIRMGYVREITETHLVLDQGLYSTCKGAVHIDCTSSSLRNQPEPVPIWSDNRIVMQLLMEVACAFGELNTSLSATVIGYAEATCKDANENNGRCTPTRFPDTIYDWEHLHYEHYSRVQNLLKDKKIQWKLLRTRPSNCAMLTGDELAHFSDSRDRRMLQNYQSRKVYSAALAVAAKHLADQRPRMLSPPPQKSYRPSKLRAHASTQTDPEVDSDTE